MRLPLKLFSEVDRARDTRRENPAVVCFSNDAIGDFMRNEVQCHDELIFGNVIKATGMETGCCFYQKNRFVTSLNSFRIFPLDRKHVRVAIHLSGHLIILFHFLPPETWVKNVHQQHYVQLPSDYL